MGLRWRLMTGSLYVSIPIVEWFSAENWSPVKIGPKYQKWRFFARNRGLNVKIYFRNPKGIPLRGTASFGVFVWRSVWGPRLWATGRTQRNNSRTWEVIFHRTGRKKPSPIRKKIVLGRFPGHNHPCKLWDRSVSDFSVACGQILGFSIGFRRCPYNTLALPCECVI